MSIKLTPQKKQAVKAEILSLLSSLRDEIGSELVDARTAHWGQSVHDHGEEAAADLETGINLAHVSRHLKEVRECQAALSRLENGTYGICVDCGEEVELNRLAANPVSARCLSCQAQLESDYPVAKVSSL